ncbi:GntP family permease [Dietzia aurantiaca]
MILSMLGIALSLVFLITLAYRGYSVIYIAPIAALIAVIFSGVPLLATYTQVFMPAMGGFIISYFPLFLTGAIFGSLISATGYARDIAHWLATLIGPSKAIFITVLATSLLTYGGVSAWVVIFSIFPIATALFREADIPRRLMPASVMLGLFTFGLATLPGTPQIHNTMPGQYFGTNTFAAPILSILSTFVLFGLGMAWLTYRQRKLKAAGESYFDVTVMEQREAEKLKARVGGGGENDDDAPDSAPSVPVATGPPTDADLPVGDVGIHKRGILGLLPILVVTVMNALATYVIIPGMDTAYLAEEQYGATSIDSLVSIWSVIIALVAGILWMLAVKFREINALVKTLSEGAQRAVVPAAITASEVGYGAVIASLATFAFVRDGLSAISDNALVTGVLSVAGVSGITGSASGGLAISLEAFGNELATAATQQGIDMEIMHRVLAMASTSFDSLPHNGAMLTVLLVCGLTHKEAYKDIFVVSVMIPVIGVVFAATLGLAVGAF